MLPVDVESVTNDTFSYGTHLWEMEICPTIWTTENFNYSIYSPRLSGEEKD